MIRSEKDLIIEEESRGLSQQRAGMRSSERGSKYRGVSKNGKKFQVNIIFEILIQ